MRGHLHWIVYWHAILFFVLMVLSAAWGVIGMMAAAGFGVLFVLSFAHAWFIRWIAGQRG